MVRRSYDRGRDLGEGGIVISWVHLLWIVPLCVMIGIFLFAMLEAARDDDRPRDDN